jgi:hypothetical protein
LNLLTKPLQSLRFDTLNIALSYGIRPIVSGIFIIDKFGHKFTTSASIYEESLKENADKYVDQKMRTQGTGTSVGGAGTAKRMAVGSFPPHRSQGRTSGNPPALSQRNQTSELCKKCNHVH